MLNIQRKCKKPSNKPYKRTPQQSIHTYTILTNKGKRCNFSRIKWKLAKEALKPNSIKRFLLKPWMPQMGKNNKNMSSSTKKKKKNLKRGSHVLLRGTSYGFVWEVTFFPPCETPHNKSNPVTLTISLWVSTHPNLTLSWISLTIGLNFIKKLT